MFDFSPLGLRLWRKNKAPLPGASTAAGFEPTILDQDRRSHAGKQGDGSSGEELLERILECDFWGASGSSNVIIAARQHFDPFATEDTKASRQM